MKDQIERIQSLLERRYRIKAVPLSSVPVREVFDGDFVWEGIVETFVVLDKPGIRRAYGWLTAAPDPECIILLEIPPVAGPHTAVRTYMSSLRNESPRSLPAGSEDVLIDT